VAVYGAAKKKDLDKEIITITSSGGIASGYAGHVSVELFLSTYSPREQVERFIFGLGLKIFFFLNELQPFVDNLAKMGHQFLALKSENSRLEAENTRLEAEAVKARGKYSTTVVPLLAVLDFILTVYF
jgi:hypothetical protein